VATELDVVPYAADKLVSLGAKAVLPPPPPPQAVKNDARINAAMRANDLAKGGVFMLTPEVMGLQSNDEAESSRVVNPLAVMNLCPMAVERCKRPAQAPQHILQRF
jgi:hypothetical protein